MAETDYNGKAPLIEVTDLSVHFPSQRGAKAAARKPLRAVDGVSFSVAPGESVGMVGESGCGKSTIARVLLALQKPTSGKLRLDGKEVDFDQPARLRRSAQMVFQDPFSSLNPRLRVWTQVAEPVRGHLGVRSKADLRHRAMQALAAVGFDEKALDRFPHQFSGGQRQRIALARALSIEPRLLVADEPMASLDVTSQAEISELLIRLREERELALLLISHDLAGIGALTGRVLVVYLGRIVEEGPTNQVLGKGLHPYTHALLDAAPRLEPKKSRKRIVLDGDPPSPYDPPPGCVFHTRCPHVMERCRSEVPRMVDVSAGHRAACFLLESTE